VHVVLDNLVDDPDLTPYLDYLRDPMSSYTTLMIPLDAGLEVSIWRSQD
jgi:hypothetical protein